MESSENLPQVLCNTKLHRRSILGNAVSRNCSVDGQEAQLKYKCPPIELKEKISTHEKDTEGNTHSFQPVPAPLDRNFPDGSCSPLSPASGLSPACAAMASACSHDHDYICADFRRFRRDSALANRSESPSKFDKSDESNIRTALLDMKTIRVPIPPKGLLPSSPRDAKPTRETVSRPHRRLLKPSHDQAEKKSSPARTTKATNKASSVDNTCVFVSTSRTAEPRRVRSRTARKSGKVENVKTQTQNEAADTDATETSVSSVVSSISNAASSDCASVDGNTEEREEFDVTKDKLTAEWLKMVKKYRPKKSDSKDHLADTASFVDIGIPKRESTPVRTNNANFENGIPTPLPCSTPCPPTLSRRSERRTKPKGNAPAEDEDNPDLDSSEMTEQDSAYFSINSSTCSLRPTISAGTPLFRASSRPSTGNRSAGSTRPPSSGKRQAADSLSSTSSGTSSDEDSLCSSLSSQKADEYDENKRESGLIDDHDTSASEEPSNFTSECALKDIKAVKARKGKKFVRQIDVSKAKKSGKLQIRPVPPPRKFKRDPLPMNRRALPLSFFQEPNRVGSSPYSILPPVQPLFRQPNCDDIADIRPVTPPEKRAQVGTETSCNDERRVVITNGDTDLLQRLFDAVEPQYPTTGRPVKRGRPKRTPRLLPSPKLKLDDNPCIMQSITEKLFPNLTLEKRHSKGRTVRAHNASVLLAGECSSRSRDDTCYDNQHSNGSFSIDIVKELEQFGLLSFNSPLHDEETVDVPMDMTSPTITSERIALPQLPLTQDYSQLLTDVAAVL